MHKIEAVREEFPALSSTTFLRSAGVGPLPRSTISAMLRLTEELRVSFAGAAWEDNPLEDARSHAADLLNAHSEEIVLTDSTSTAINLLAGAIPWQARENIVLNDLEYPANIFPWLYQAERNRLKIRMVRCEDGRLPLDKLMAAIDNKTRVVSLSHLEFGTGFRNDVSALAEAVHDCGGLIWVDAIQSLGVLSIDINDWA